jgi:UDP-3-O-acyl-N-acetylglucosamine deacetylase
VRKQGTLRGVGEVEGRGLHSGEAVKVVLRPDETDRGIRFVRTDLDKRVEVPLDERFLLRDERQTVLARDGAEVHTVEHLTASLVALGIDNVLVEIDRPELPGLDGSARD